MSTKITKKSKPMKPVKDTGPFAGQKDKKIRMTKPAEAGDEPK